MTWEEIQNTLLSGRHVAEQHVLYDLISVKSNNYIGEYVSCMEASG